MTSALSSNWNLNDFLFYIKKENEILAQGYYSCQSSPKRFTVLKGAKCCRDLKPSAKGPHHQNKDGRSRHEIKQQDLIDDGTLMPERDILLLTKNHEFNSPSQASIIILGTSNSGPGTWKNERGVSIKKLKTQDHILMDNNTGENLDKTSRKIQRESEDSKADLPSSPGELQEKLLQEFEDKVSSISQTEIKQLGHKQRIGQDILRKYLMMYWEGQCPLTGINDEDLLRASHIKPWTKCENNGVGSFGLMSGQGGWPMTVQRECSKASLGFSSSCRTWTQQSWTIDSQKTNPLVFLRRLCRREPSNGVSLSDSGMPPDGQGGRAIIV